MNKEQRLAKLEAETANLTNFGGQGGDFESEMLMSYQGGFGAGSQFDAGSKTLQLKVVNGLATNEEFYLVPSYKVASTANGHPQSGKSIEGNVLTYSIDPNTLAEFYEFLKYNPTLVESMKISTTDADNLSESITTTRMHPVVQNGITNKIFLSEYQDANNQNDKIVTVKGPLQFDIQTQIKMAIKAGTTIVITFKFGPIVSLSDALLRFANRNIAKSRTPMVNFDR